MEEITFLVIDIKNKGPNKKEIKKIITRKKKQKETEEVKKDKFTCSSYGNIFTGYCISCKKDMLNF